MSELTTVSFPKKILMEEIKNNLGKLGDNTLNLYIDDDENCYIQSDEPQSLETYKICNLGGFEPFNPESELAQGFSDDELVTSVIDAIAEQKEVDSLVHNISCRLELI